MYICCVINHLINLIKKSAADGNRQAKIMKLLTSLASYNQYGVELRERNYPKFEGFYNAYVEVYGAVSGEFLGLIETPLKENVKESDLPELLNMLPAFINVSHSVSNW